MTRGGSSRQTSQNDDGISTSTTTVVQASQLPPIEKLRGSANWSNWKFLMELYLGLEDLKECLTTAPPDEVIADPQSAEMKKDTRARTKICLSIETDLIRYVRGTKTAKEAWDMLCEAFEDKGVHRRIALLYGLFGIKHDNYDSLQKYIMDFKDTVTKIAETGKPIDEEIAGALLLSNLRAEYTWICQLIQRTCTTKVNNVETLQFDVVVTELLKEAQKEESEKRQVTTSGPALQATGGGARNSNRRGHQHGGAAPHPATRERHRSQPPARKQQKLSQQQHHHHHKQTTQDDDSDEQQSQQRKAKRWCHSCKNATHFTKDCWFRKLNSKNKDSVETSNLPPRGKGPQKWVVNLAAKHAASDKNMVGSADNVTKLNKSSSEWYIDSGAFKVMSGDKDIFSNYQSLDDKQKIDCAGNQQLFTEGVGDLILNGKNNLKEIQNVAYVPGLTSNLLSVSSITQSGLCTVFDKTGCGIYFPEDVIVKGKPILHTQESNGTYKVKLNIAKNVALKTDSISNSNIWHKRLAHLGKNNLKLMSQGLVDGMDNNVTDLDAPCDICLKARQTRAPLPKHSDTRASELLEIIHSDVCEVTDTNSLEGYRYFLTFIDDKSRFTFVAFLKKKDQVFAKFTQYKILVEKHLGKNIKILRTDNGGEYCSKQFDDFLKQEGIIRQLTVPDTPEQEGVGERANRTLLEKVRALVKEAGLDIKLWPLAMDTAVYLKNLSPTKAVKGMVPFEAWTGTKPSIKHLKTFGCSAYLHIPRKSSKKLGDRSRELVFVGYDEEKKGYKLLNLDNPRQIIVERSIKFNENKFPARAINDPVSIIQGENLFNPMASSEVIIQQTNPKSNQISSKIQTIGELSHPQK